MTAHNSPQAATADIALILEGSYPFVTGGVSQWVQQIIENFPQYTFAVLFLGSSPENYTAGLRYQLPSNVVHLQIEYLFASETAPKPEDLTANQRDFEKITALHQEFRQNLDERKCPMADISSYLDTINSIEYRQFLYSKNSWDYITAQYTEYCTDPSFIDYFWTVKNIHRPLWVLANIINHIPKVKVLHTISTGYAGLIGALLHHHYSQTSQKLPLILTEHGIYTKERRIDILHSEIVRDYSVLDRGITDVSYLRDLWNRYFETLGRLCYQAADPIISLFSAAHTLQLEGGAPAEKTRIIANGINIARFSPLRRAWAERECVIGFIGRVVPIKDVKNFIRSIAVVLNQLPQITAWIVGGEDEDPEYAQECHELVETLSLQQQIVFKSYQKVEDIFPRIQLMVLSSISESMPLVLLESFAAGVPVVATDVGACSELIYGIAAEDKAIGPCGATVKIADPQALGQAVVNFLTNQELWEQASKAAILRVEKFYDEKMMIAKYSDIYAERIR